MDQSHLKKYSECVRRELKELLALASFLEAPWTAEPTGETTLRSALLESVLTHARCLIEFLLNKKGGYTGDNIVGTTFGRWPSPTGDGLAADYEKISTHLSHLSKKRTTHGAPTWDVRLLVDRILRAFEEYAAALHRTGSPHTAEFQQVAQECRSAYVQCFLSNPAGAGQVFTTADSYLHVIPGSTGLFPRSDPEPADGG